MSYRMTWLCICSSRTCNSLASGETDPGLITGISQNLEYVKLPNIYFLVQQNVLKLHELYLFLIVPVNTAKSLPSSWLFLLLVIARKQRAWSWEKLQGLGI